MQEWLFKYFAPVDSLGGEDPAKWPHGFGESGLLAQSQGAAIGTPNLIHGEFVALRLDICCLVALGRRVWISRVSVAAAYGRGLEWVIHLDRSDSSILRGELETCVVYLDYPRPWLRV